MLAGVGKDAAAGALILRDLVLELKRNVLILGHPPLARTLREILMGSRVEQED